MKATAVIRLPDGAVEEVPITASPREIDQLVQDGWEIWFRWSLLDYAGLIAWSLMGLFLGVAAASIALVS